MTEVINITTNLTGGDRVRDGLAGITGGLGNLTKIGAAAVAGFAAASIAGFTAAAAKMIDYGDTLSKMAIKTGVSVEALSQLKHAADMSDVSMEQLGSSFKFMSKAVADAESGTGAAAKAFGDLNINYEAFKNLKPEDQFTVLAEKLSGVKDTSSRTQIAMTLLGRAGVDMLPMLADGAAGLEKMRDQADSLGLTMSTDAAKSMEAFNDAMTSLGAAVTGAFQKIVVDFTPALVSMTKWLGELVPAAGAIFTSSFETIRQVILRVSEYALFAFGKMAQAIGWLAESVGVTAFSEWGDTLVEISDSLKITADDYANVSKEVAVVAKEQSNLSDIINNVTGSTYVNKEAVTALAKEEESAAKARQKHFEDANAAHKQVLENLDEEIKAMERRDQKSEQDAFNERARVWSILKDEIDAMDRRDNEDAKKRAKESERRKAAIAGMSDWERAWLSYETVAKGVFGTVNKHMVDSVADAKRGLGDMFGDIFTRTESVGDAVKKFFESVKNSILESLGQILADKIWQTLVSAFVGGGAAGGAAGGAGSGLFGGAIGGLFGGGGGGGAAAGAGAAPWMGGSGATAVGAGGGAGLASAGSMALILAAIVAAGAGLEKFGPRIEDWLKDDPLGGLGSTIVGGVEQLGGAIKDDILDDVFGIKFASGTDSVFSKPTMFLAGENGPERVQVTPTNQFQRGGSGGHTYNFYGPVMMDQIAMDKFQRGLMQGMSSEMGRFG